MDSSHYDGTDWSGTAFNCPSANSIISNMIFLPHEHFSSVARGTCNNGTIVAEGTEVNGSFYMSTLTIAPVTLDMTGQTIICSVSGIILIGTGNTSSFFSIMSPAEGLHFSALVRMVLACNKRKRNNFCIS